jgi:excisionase family DNA binding protein
LSTGFLKIMKKNKNLKKYIPQKLLSTHQVARMFRVDDTTITQAAREGRLPAFKVGRLWRFPENDLHDFIAKAQADQRR